MIDLGALNSLQVPDLWQQEAVRHLRAGRDVIVDAPTGAGKTFVFESLVESRALKGQAIYTVPTRALANDKRQEWQRRRWNVGIATGDVAENLDAPVVVATLETQRDRLLEGRGPALLVIDEYQMLADPVRGLSYEIALAVAPLSTRLLLLSGSVANAADVQAWMRRLGRSCELVSTRVRPVPLDEMPLESLPQKAPATLGGFWPRLAVEVLLANLGPLLIFAPRRAMAEKIALQIAAALPADDPLGLSERQHQVCGRDLAAALEKRVTWHHSGLGYQARAGVVEPLAKAGKLRVVVATTGLAAGINFSVRSVLVAETRYFDGRLERALSRDELLQMFGRAGRRGLDTAGYVITTRTSPRLADAAPLKLMRGHDLDWPPLLRVMHLAAARGDSPLDAALKLNRSLFSDQQPDLGFGTAAPASPAVGGRVSTPRPALERSWFGLGPTRMEVCNSAGEWETHDPARLATGPLGAAFVRRDGQLHPALAYPAFVAGQFKIGRPCRLTGAHDPAPRYGRGLALGRRAEGRRQFVLTEGVRRRLGESPGGLYGYDQIASEIIARLAPHFEGGEPAGLQQIGELLVLHLDYSHAPARLYQDRHGILLAAPDHRAVDPGGDGVALDPTPASPAVIVRPGTPAAAWRHLGLIDSTGVPTRRGVLTSFFHQGEGLAIAAALEDATLPVAELVPLLANLRAGPRFAQAAEGTVDRLALACRQAYGIHDVDGYLSLGLPPGYGAGAAEWVADVLHHPHDARRRWTSESIGEGDLERTVTEWLSLLRHVQHSPDWPWPRWRELRAAAAAELEAHACLLPSRRLPDIPPRQLVHQVDLALSYSRLRKG